MSRAATMVLALLVMNVLLGTLCVVVARGERKSDGLRLWGWGQLAYSIGLLITLAVFLPTALIKMVGNALIAYAPIPSVTGALVHTQYRLKTRWLAIGYVASVVPIVINHLRPHPLVLIDFLAPAPLANVLFVIAVVALIRRPPSDAKTAARFLAAIFLFAVLVWSLRMLSLWLSVGGTNNRDRSDLVVALFAIAQMVVSVAATLGFLWVEVRKMEADLERIAYFDTLTGLPNRRATLMRFQDELARASRHKQEFAMVVIDIDHFKHVNDTYGHQAGDAILAHVASLLEAGKRSEDLLGRIGGEEFVLLLSDNSVESAVEAANRIREGVAVTSLKYEHQMLKVTVSGGLSMYPSDGMDWDTLFLAADDRLYAAKQKGRNCIIGPAEHVAAEALVSERTA
ncbi:MAG TPA: diguanylate cyclase [Blastocatellia bacterium]|nr:diguanylate cyclase [Blastocatellia bacterium]